MYGRDIRREEASYANDTSIEQARWSKILGVCSFLRIRLQKTVSERISHFAKKDLLFDPHGLGKISVCLDGFGLQIFIYSLPLFLCSCVKLVLFTWFCESLLW